jgi:hypothetical protein
MKANMEELVRNWDTAWVSWDVERILSYFTDDKC